MGMAMGARPGEADAREDLERVSAVQADLMRLLGRESLTLDQRQRLEVRLALVSQEVGVSMGNLFWALMEGRP